MTTEELASFHLLLRLRPIHRALRSAAARQAESAARLDRADLMGVCVTDQQAADLLDDVDQLIRLDTFNAQEKTAAAPLAPDEIALEQRYRQAARTAGYALPLDRLAAEVTLDPFEQEVMLVCAAAELDRGYERILAYLQDDLKRLFPTIELVCHLTASGTRQRLARRRAVGAFGRLRRCGLVEAFGEAATELRTQLRLAPGVLEFLLGRGATSPSVWRDPDEIDNQTALTAEVDPDVLQHMGQALAGGTLQVVGIWGQPASKTEEAAAALTRAAALPLRRLPLERWPTQGAEHALHLALVTAETLGAALQIPVDLLREPELRRLTLLLEEALARCRVPCLLTGADPWRPTSLLASRPYAEIELPAPTYPVCRRHWQEALPEVERGRLDDLAGRFRMCRREIQAVARLARTQAQLDSNGEQVRVQERLDAACLAVARKSGGRFISLVRPRRGPDDLVLAPKLHRQVVEIAHFSRVLPRVADAWGFGRLATGGSGLKVLFTGDPGTGKTMAAEVIAGLLAVPLLKVNIGQTVSKWIGETEKNLDEAFSEAASSHAVLFIDEADALCGQRAGVRHGSDRYANTEVSHLLQRLEDHDGLVILASNLKDNIDAAFLRRFHVILPFPRPAEADRCRIWARAFPPEAPLDGRVDLDVLACLDMTGAGIAGAARTAALLAAEQGAAHIHMAHVVQGVARQYLREGRLLTPAELGPHAALLQEK